MQGSVKSESTFFFFCLTGHQTLFSKICQLAGDDADGNYDGDDNYDGDANCDYDQGYEC